MRQIIHFYNATQAPSITPPTVAARADNRGAETWKRWSLAAELPDVATLATADVATV